MALGRGLVQCQAVHGLSLDRWRWRGPLGPGCDQFPDAGAAPLRKAGHAVDVALLREGACAPRPAASGQGCPRLYLPERPRSLVGDAAAAETGHD